jgi:hypothetical protein
VPIGATEFKAKFSRPQIERMVKRDIEIRFKKDPKYSRHVREDVPGSDIKKYGRRGCTSSKGTFCKSTDYQSGGGLAALFTGGWMRVAKDRIDPVAWSHQFGLQRKSNRQNWRHHFLITERNGNQSHFELPREKLGGTGVSAIRLLMKVGVHVVARDVAQKLLVRFLHFKPKQEIIRLPRAGWAQVGSHWIFVRPDEVITPPGMPRQRETTYVLDTTVTRHGLHVADDAFGVSWGGTEAGFDALALARTDLGLPLDEITLANPRTVYKVASGTKGPRATSSGDLRATAHASVLALSTGEKSLAQFIGKNLQEGARKRLVDVPAEVQPGSAFETISRDQIHDEGKRLFDAIKRQHGAVGRDWHRHLVALGLDRIKAELQKHREAFLALPEFVAITQKAHPQGARCCEPLCSPCRGLAHGDRSRPVALDNR